MNNKIIKNKLKQLEFTQHEADVYLALLEIGITSAGKIIKKTGLHRNVIYTTLNKLANKKLVMESNKRGVKYFKASNIDRILKEKERQFILAQKIVPQLKNIKGREKIEVIIYEGIEGFQTAHIEAIDQMSKNKVIYVLMAGGTTFYEFMEDKIKYFDKKRKQNHNKVKLLASHGRATELQKWHTQKRMDVEVKYLSMEFINPIGSAVYGDKTLLFIYTDMPVVITIDSKIVAGAHIEQFKMLWKTAKKS